MKIISNKECYVQVSDIENLVYYEPNISSEMQIKLGALMLNSGKNSNSYIKIMDNSLLDFILSCENIPDFSELNGKSISELELIVLKLKVAILDLSESTGEIMSPQERNQAKIAEYKERKNREYMLSQIKEAIAYKMGLSKVNYPDVPNPCVEPITNENLCASKAINYNSILIYNIDGKPINEEVDKEFCKVAFGMLMDEKFDEDLSEFDVSCNMSKNKKYVAVEKEPQRVLDEKRNIIRKLVKKNNK